MFSRPSDLLMLFCVLFRIIGTAEPSRTSTMEHFAKTVKGFQLLTHFIKIFILDIRLGFEYISE